MRRNLPKYLLGTVMLFGMLVSYAQSKITGRVVDAVTIEGLPGASVQIKGTTNGTITDFNGDFTISADGREVTVVVSFVGYEPQELTINLAETQSFGNISLQPGANELSPLEVIASVAVERKTPVAVSSIKKEFILANASNQEFPELLKTTPGVYATKQGGGYGDSHILVRGFSSENVAVLINGVPVNDMENGRVYWSNWAGLTDVTSSMQVQRGLGASKVAVPSIGGTINVLTQNTDAVKGGNVYTGIGNNGYLKNSIYMSTGLTDKGWAVSVQGAKITGNGWADGLQFEGYNYFFNVSKTLGKNHTLSLTGFGAPQRHGQRQNYQRIATYRHAPNGRRYNADWGYKNGQVVNVEDNFYNKPQFSLNHYWSINSKSELSTAVYASIGTGGGGGYATEADVTDPNGDNQINFRDYRIGNTTYGSVNYGPYDLDAIVKLNGTSTDGRSLGYLRASRNDHKWFGMLSSYSNQITDKIDLLGGLDLRYYQGSHFTEVTDLLGGQFVFDNSDVNNPNRHVGVGDKISYYNDSKVYWTGAFLQGEYTDGPLNVFVSLAGSNTSYQRIDYYQYTPDNQKTDFVNFIGYQAKGGVNYNLTRNHNVFVNVGNFQKAPYMNAVFLNNQNVLNKDAKNQKITSFELGYGYKTKTLSANVNLYSTSWKDRTFTRSFPGQDGQYYFANILGVDALHQGVEVDVAYNPIPALKIKGMLSVGNWRWANNVDSVTVFNELRTESNTIDKLYIKDLKVGGAAQTTASISGTYKIVKNFSIGVTYNYYGNLYANFDPTTRTGTTDTDGNLVLPSQAWKMPNYNLLDANANYSFKIGELDATFYANVQNLFDVAYISDAQDGPTSSASDASVFYGIGRTWTSGLRIKF